MTVLALMLMFLIAPAGQLGTAVSNTVIKGGVIKGGSSTPVCAPVSILNVCIIPPQAGAACARQLGQKVHNRLHCVN